MTEERVRRKVSGILSADEVVAAFQAQSVLFEKFISMARSPDEPEVIKTMLRETIEISIELTGAELGEPHFTRQRWPGDRQYIIPR